MKDDLKIEKLNKGYVTVSANLKRVGVKPMMAHYALIIQTVWLMALFHFRQTSIKQEHKAGWLRND